MIKVYITNGVPLVWTAEDACKLREDYRIVGTMTGCLPRAPKQNVFLGLPLQLRPEEVTILRNKGICKLIDGSQAVKLPTQEDVELFKEHRKKSYMEQVEISREQKKRDIMQHKDEIIAGKKVKWQKLLEQRRAAGEIITEEEINREPEFNIADIEILPLPEKSSLIQICGANPNPGPQSEADWTYPNGEDEKLRFRVFSDLWEKGYYLTNGCKFGADFLVYPGDPVRFHSFYIAVCLPHGERQSIMKLATLGRLGTSVKKTVLLCSVNDSDQLSYTSLQWTGISY